MMNQLELFPMGDPTDPTILAHEEAVARLDSMDHMERARILLQHAPAATTAADRVTALRKVARSQELTAVETILLGQLATEMAREAGLEHEDLDAPF